MKKYIAGFRSGNPKTMKKAIAYYGLVTFMVLVGGEASLNSLALWLILMATPSLVVSFKDMRLKGDGYIGRRNTFLKTLGVYIVIILLFNFTSTPVNTRVDDSNLGKYEAKKQEDEKVNLPDIDSDNKEYKKEDKKDNNTVVNGNKAEIHFINTGNSDAILIKQGDKSALIDGGDNDDEGRVVSYLKKQGVKELEYVFATHPHADHIGGLDAVVKNVFVKNVFVSNGGSDTATYKDFINSMANRGLSPSVPLLNAEFPLGTSKFKVVSVANSNDTNNNSLVLLYTNGNDSVLLTGDAEKEIEKNLNVGDIDLLKVGHHGSSSSSSLSFINKIKPEEAVILVGENNKYGHPHRETMTTLKDKNIKVHRSDECGDVVYVSTGNGLKTSCKQGSYVSGREKSGSTSQQPPQGGNPTSKPQVESPKPSGGGIVYFTPNGKSYHTTNTCSTLSRSKVINSGTLSQSGKSDPCDKCN